MRVYIIRDKVGNVFAGTPFLANNDDEATRIFHLSACKSPFRSDLSLYSLGMLTEHGVGIHNTIDSRTDFYPQCDFVSDFSESYLKRYEVTNDEEQA